MFRSPLFQMAKWSFALTVLAVALFVACQGHLCHHLARGALDGAGFGLGFGMLVQFSHVENARRLGIPRPHSLSWKEVLAEVRAAFLIGFFTGLAEALQQLLAG